VRAQAKNAFRRGGLTIQGEGKNSFSFQEKNSSSASHGRFSAPCEASVEPPSRLFNRNAEPEAIKKSVNK
jgi:hypothetical protein